ncbi:hypothetical protein [Plectonema radiosum]|nr:hypothetical protein [Plectonema radiosum]
MRSHSQTTQKCDRHPCNFPTNAIALSNKSSKIKTRSHSQHNHSKLNAIASSNQSLKLKRDTRSVKPEAYRISFKNKIKTNIES